MSVEHRFVHSRTVKAAITGDAPRAHRALAVVAFCGAVDHVLLAVQHAAMIGLAVASMVMALMCMPCAGHLWRSGSPRSLIASGAGAMLMLVLHLSVLPLSSSFVPPVARAMHMHHHGVTALHAGGASAAFDSSMIAPVVSFVEGLVVNGCALMLLQQRASATGGTE